MMLELLDYYGKTYPLNEHLTKKRNRRYGTDYKRLYKQRNCQNLM